MFALIVPIFLFLCERYTHATPYYVRPDPPRFTQQPQSTTLPPGYQATLSCAINAQSIISGYNTVEMHWEYNGTIVENPELLSNVVLSEVKSDRLKLIFRYLNELNTGRYRCVMQDGLFSIVSEVAELALFEFSGFIESSVFNITAYHGDNIYIDCRATTNSLLSVTWYKGSLALSPTQRIITLPDGILVISNVTDSDTGNYTCHLNLVSQYKEKTVEVRIRTPSVIAKQEIISVTGQGRARAGSPTDSQLQFLHKPQNKSVLLNDRHVYLLCVATGNVSSYIWTKDGVSIHDSGIEYQLAAGGSVLNFTSISDKIQGVYTCMVRSETNQTINSMAWIDMLIPPVIDGSESTSDINVLVDIDDSTLFPLTTNCPIKRSSPAPTVLWLRNGLPVHTEDLDAGFVSYKQGMSPTTTGYDYTLRIRSDNSTYQFVLDNIIGMYQCLVSNEAGQVIINRRFLFKYKPNPVDQPILHDPVCDDGCRFLVEWNHTDHYYLSRSQRNYVVYMSIDGIHQRVHECINVHSTSCTIEYDITEIRFGKYAAAVQAVYSYDYKSPDKTSDLSNFSNVVQLDYSSYPSNAVKPCEMSCNSFTRDSYIYMGVSWSLCPYEDFNGYVDNYIVILDCSDNYPHDPASIFTHTASPGLLNYTFEQVPCFRNCELIVKKRSSNYGANSNSSITCDRTPKLRPQSAVYNVTVNRGSNSNSDYGLQIDITFDLPPVSEMCSSDDVSRVLVKWKGSDDIIEHLRSFDTADVLGYVGHGSIKLRVDDTYLWKAVNVAVSFDTIVGSSPWSEWHSISSATNRNIEENEDFPLEVLIPTSYNSITVKWMLSARAKSMIQAKFIRSFNYIINGASVNGSLEDTYTFSNLSAATTYHIVGIVITSDNVSDPVKIYVNETRTLNGPTTGPPPSQAASETSSEGLSDTVIIVITVCTAVVVVTVALFVIYRCRSGMCKAKSLSLQSNVVSHHLLEQNKSHSSTSQTTESEIGVPTTPKTELVKDWLYGTGRNNPPGSDGQHASYFEENGQSDSGQENEMKVMLETITTSKPDPTFKLDPPPPSKKKHAITAEVHRSLDKNELNIDLSSHFTSDKEGDYTKIASDAPGASTSGGSKHTVLMDMFTEAPQPSSNVNKMTEFNSASPKHILLNEPQQDSSTHSSGTEPYLERPYLYNENEQLLAAISGTRESSYNCIVADNHVSAPSSLLSSDTSESSSANCQGEGYVSEENAALLAADNMTSSNQSAYPQLKSSYQANQNTTTKLIATSFDENVSTSKDGEYISPLAFENFEKQQNTKKKTHEGSSSVDSDCIGDCYDNSPVDV